MGPLTSQKTRTGSGKTLLSLSCWNVNGLRKNSTFDDKLTNTDFLQCFDRSDIIILTETWAKTDLSFPNFELLSITSKKYKTAKHGRSSGGIAIGFKRNLAQGIKPISFNADYIWCKLDKTFFSLEQDIFLCAIYIPPKDSIYFNPDSFRDLEADIATFSSIGYIILAGDFNARTARAQDYIEVDNNGHIPGDMPVFHHNLSKRNNYDCQINDHGKVLLDICKTCNLRILNGRTKGDSFGKITYHSPHGISTVDYIIVSDNFSNSVQSLMVKQPTIFSDHSQIVCWINITPSTPTHDQTTSQIRMFNLPKQFLWQSNSTESFLNVLKLDEYQSRLLTFEKTQFEPTSKGVNSATKQFTDLLNDISLRSLKLKNTENTKKKKRSKRWFDSECFTWRKILTDLSKKKHNNPLDENIRHNYHTTRKHYKKLIKSKKLKLLNSKIDNLVSKKGNQEFWHHLKLIHEDKQKATHRKLEVNIDNLHNHFKKLHSEPELSSLSPFHLSVIQNKLALEQQKEIHNSMDEPFSVIEIETTIKLLKCGKAPGPDRIRNEMLKTGSIYLKTSICKLFNLILESGFFPTNWCEGVITPIFKSGDKRDPANHRGICISSCLGKLFSAVLNSRLTNYIEDNNIMNKAQIGFMANHRTTDHIFTLRTLIDKHVTHTTSGKLYTCFVDFKKAFDSIWHDGLLYKLLTYKIGGKFYDLIKSLYLKSKCSIKLDHQQSAPFEYGNGVRQGCILSPMLFNLYINELPSLLNMPETDPVILPNGSSINCLLYADDLVLISQSAIGLQNALSALSKFCTNWLMNINIKKTKIVIFQKKRRKSTALKHHFFINKKEIEITDNYTYLGVKFSTNGSFKEHKVSLKEKAKRSIFATRQHLDFLKLPIDISNKLFDSLYLPILMYGSEIWGTYDKDDYNSWENDIIEKTHIQFCKQVLGVNKQCPNAACRNELGRLPLKQIIDINIIKFWIHLESQKDDHYAKQCLQISKDMADKNQMSLIKKVNTLCNNSNLNGLFLNDNNSSRYIKEVQLTLHKELTLHQYNLIRDNKKLKFYSIFKKDCHKSDCLNTITNISHKKTLNKLRLGNHRLQVELGRHTTPKTPENLRICPFCHLDEVENELHFIFNCTLYDSLRVTFFRKINSKYPFFNHFDSNEKTLFLFNNVDPHIYRLTAAHIHSCMEHRQKFIL